MDNITKHEPTQLDPAPETATPTPREQEATAQDLEWEVEVIAERYQKLATGTKSAGSQGCH